MGYVILIEEQIYANDSVASAYADARSGQGSPSLLRSGRASWCGQRARTPPPARTDRRDAFGTSALLGKLGLVIMGS